MTDLTLTTSSQTACALTEAEMLHIADVVLEALDVARPCALSVSVVDNSEIQKLNCQWRGIDRPTDVLSFECERPDDPDLVPGEVCELGDIVLAPEYIAHQAFDFKTTTADETRLLFVHGMLHLMGYDHEEDAEAHKMHQWEEKILHMLPSDNSLTEHVLIRHRNEDAL